MNIALERLFVKYIIYVYIQSFLYILCLGTIPILRQLKDWVGGWVGSEKSHFCWSLVRILRVTSPALGSNDLSLNQSGTSIQILPEPNDVTWHISFL